MPDEGGIKGQVRSTRARREQANQAEPEPIEIGEWERTSMYVDVDDYGELRARALKQRVPASSIVSALLRLYVEADDAEQERVHQLAKRIRAARRPPG